MITVLTSACTIQSTTPNISTDGVSTIPAAILYKFFPCCEKAFDDTKITSLEELNKIWSKKNPSATTFLGNWLFYKSTHPDDNDYLFNFLQKHSQKIALTILFDLLEFAKCHFSDELVNECHNCAYKMMTNSIELLPYFIKQYIETDSLTLKEIYELVISEIKEKDKKKLFHLLAKCITDSYYAYDIIKGGKIFLEIQKISNILLISPFYSTYDSQEELLLLLRDILCIFPPNKLPIESKLLIALLNHLSFDEKDPYLKVLRIMLKNFHSKKITLIEQLEPIIIDSSKNIETAHLYTWTLFLRAMALGELSCYKEGLNDLEIILSLPPNALYLGALAISGRYFWHLNHFDEALELFNLILQISPNDVAVLTLRGNIYGEKNEYKNALKDIKKAIEITPQITLLSKLRDYIFYKQSQIK